VQIDIQAGLLPDTERGAQSDHGIVRAVIKLPKELKIKPFSYSFRIFSEEGKQKLSREIENICQDFSLKTCTDETVSFFQSELFHAYNECYPIKTVTRPNNMKPWRDKHQVRILKDLASEGRKNGKSERWARKQRAVDARERWLVSRYCKSTLNKLKSSNPKTYWDHLKKLAGMNKANQDFDLLDLFPAGITNYAAVNATAEFFASVSNEHEQINNQFAGTSFPSPIITPEFVISEIKKMKRKRSSPPDDFPITLVQDNLEHLARPLADIFTQIFATGIYPSVWKIETASIIPKTGHPTSLSHTRNISLTPSLSKLCERIILTFLEVQIIPKLNLSQFGGIKGSGIDLLLTKLFDEVSSAIDRGDVAILTSIDFSKAFNRINHNLLIRDLIDLGADAWLVRVLSSYLDKRMMRVKYKDVLSELVHMKGGTPQGSLIGVALFITYMNEISRTIDGLENTRLYQFVDDTYILQLVPREELVFLEDELALAPAHATNETLNRVLEVAKKREMVLNDEKTKFIVFSPPNFKATICTSIQVGSSIFERSVDTLRILGVIVTNNLSTGAHVKKTLKSVRPRLQLIKKMIHNGCTKEECIIVYKSLIRSVLEFGLDVYAPMLRKSEITEIENAQKTFIKLIMSTMDSMTSYEDFLLENKIETMADRIKMNFERMAERVVRVGQGLTQREVKKSLRKHPGFQAPRLQTLRAKETPLNVIRMSNQSITPGRTRPKTILPRLN
jgi:hypothetical protein